MALADQELLTSILPYPQHLSSLPVFSGVRVAQSLAFWVAFSGSLFVFHCFVLAIVLLVIL